MPTLSVLATSAAFYVLLGYVALGIAIVYAARGNLDTSNGKWVVIYPAVIVLWPFFLLLLFFAFLKWMADGSH